MRNPLAAAQSFLSKTYRFYFFAWFFVYLFIVAGVAVYNGAGVKKQLTRQIDEQLLIAAKSLKYMLKADFHDRAADKGAIAFEEELRNRAALSRFVSETKLKSVYTLVPKDGKLYFSAPVITEKEAQEQKSWYFYPYEDAPAFFWQALKEHKPVFVSYQDQWGSFRSVALPQFSPSGKEYLACADYETSYIKKLIIRQQLEVVLVGLLLFLVSLPFLFFYRMAYRAYAQQVQRKNLELQEYQAHLQEQVEARTRELLVSKEAAEEAARMKTNLLSNVSHEIRTPLHAIIAFSELIMHSQSLEEIHTQIRSVMSESKSLLRLINDLLDQARLEAGKFNFKMQDFFLPTVLEDVRAFMLPVAAKKSLSLDLRIDENLKCCVVGDDYRLRQILINLVGNAIKFTEKGGVTMEAALVCRESDQITAIFKVIDTGIGIPPEKLKYVFEAFFRVEGGFARKQKGTGLGTSIVKSLVERMGGRVACTSELGKGSIFWFELPFKKSSRSPETLPAAGLKVPPQERIEGFSGEILVVEDNEINQSVARLQLNHIGIRNIVVAKDGVAAIEECARKDFDLILTDLHMPLMDGFEMARRLRAFGGYYATVPIIAITADADAAVSDACKVNGINDVLLKPITLANLAAILRKWLKF